MTAGPPAGPAASVPSAPEHIDPSNVWAVEVSADQDRWTLILPANTFRLRETLEYEKKLGASVDQGWTAPAPPDYVKVTADRPGRRRKRSVLKTRLEDGSDLLVATVGAGAFGKQVSSISFAPAKRWQFPLAKLRTTAGVLNIAAVLLGAFSAAITAFLTITGQTAAPGQAPSHINLFWGVLAACCAFAAPALALIGSVFFS